MSTEVKTGANSRVKELVWFNVSVMYSAICAGLAIESTSRQWRIVLVVLAVHGALWAVYRAIAVHASNDDERPAERHAFDPIHNGADECECGLVQSAPVHY